ncbi:MAG TPA: TIGR01458 family HAD-type hydrolase [Methanoregulaceae archaeon]|nr:TIGR01458 family HAD-type hydrolase [Methanoregulaceae archaeon]
MTIKGLLIDLDGVLYTGDSAIDGAQRAIDLLGESGYRLRFVSNTTRKCRRTIAGRLQHMGFSIRETAIFTPPLAAVAFMKASGKETYMLLTTGDVEKDFPQDGRWTPGQESADYVIIGDAGENMTYDNLTRAFRLIRDGAGIIALEKDRYWMASEGLMLSAGPFVAALEYATGRSATVIGKPSRHFFTMALDDLGLPANEVAMVGDDIITDIAGAKNAGMRAILVRTGKFSHIDLEKTSIKPDEVIDSIVHLEAAL